MPGLIGNDSKIVELTHENIQKKKKESEELYNLKINNVNFLSSHGGFCGCKFPISFKNNDNKCIQKFINERKKIKELTILMKNKIQKKTNK